MNMLMRLKETAHCAGTESYDSDSTSNSHHDDVLDSSLESTLWTILTFTLTNTFISMCVPWASNPWLWVQVLFLIGLQGAGNPEHSWKSGLLVSLKIIIAQPLESDDRNSVFYICLLLWRLNIPKHQSQCYFLKWTLDGSITVRFTSEGLSCCTSVANRPIEQHSCKISFYY